MLPLALIVDLSGWISPVRSRFLATVAPVLQISSQTRWQLNQTVSRINLLSQATRQVIVLQNELTRTQSLRAQLQTLESENQALRQQLSLPPANRPKLLVTTIISYPEPLVQLPDNSQNLVGSPVMGQGILLGFIKNTDSNLGAVELLSSPVGRRLLVKTIKGVRGLAEFDGKNLVVSAIDRQASIESGDQVLTIGQPGVPAGLAIGSLGRVISAPTSATQTVIVTPPTTFYQEKVVEIRQL